MIVRSVSIGKIFTSITIRSVKIKRRKQNYVEREKRKPKLIKDLCG